MSRKKKQKIEFRYYKMQEGCVVLPLLGEKWVQHYGKEIDYLHFHNYLEIGYCYYGKGNLVLGEDIYRFSGKEVTIIPRNFPHTTTSDEGSVSKWEYLFVDVDQLIKKHFQDNPVRTERLCRRIHSAAHFLKVSNNRRLAERVRNVIEIMRRMNEFYMEEAESILCALLIDIARMNTEPEVYDQAEESPQTSSAIVSEALNYIGAHYGEPIRVQELAAYSHISETHFRRVFTSQMKMSPLEYINLVRIRSACEYLKKTDESVAMIAAKCGFTTNSTFNRNFKNVMGVTPVEWRKRPENYEQQILKFEIHSEEGW